MLRCRIRTQAGSGAVRLFEGEMPARRHRSIHLGILHQHTEGFIELTPGTRPPGEKVNVDRRHKPEHFLPAGQEHWLRRALYHAEQIIDGAYAKQRFPDGPREEVFVGVTGRTSRHAGNHHVVQTRWLWVDIDSPDKLPRLWELIAERPCHLLIESGGSGGCHAYWQLDQPLPATRSDSEGAELHQPIEEANSRLIGRVDADPACRNRDRLLRLAGTQNHKRGQWARIIQADLVTPPYTLAELIGDLRDPEPNRQRAPARPARAPADDPYRQIPAADYIARLAGLQVNAAGYVSCPSREHRDSHPSCRVGGPDPTLFKCFSCGTAGGIYDLASLVLGGPTGTQLRGDAFKAARKLVTDRYEITLDLPPQREGNR